MKKKIITFALFSCLMSGTFIGHQNSVDLYENASDLLDNKNMCVSVKKLNENEETDISQMYAQYAKSGNEYYLRFATAIKGNVTNMKFIRTMDGKSDNEKFVSSLYKGISAGGNIYYYDGNNLVTEQNSNTDAYYWACYTIKTTNTDYLNSDIKVSLFVNDQESSSASKTASINSLITNDLVLVSDFEKTSYYLNEETFDFSSITLKRVDGANNEVEISYLDCELYDNGNKMSWDDISSLSFGTHKFTLKYAGKEVELSPITINNGYITSATKIIATDKITANDKYFLEKDSSSSNLRVCNDAGVGIPYAGDIKKGSNLKFHVYSETNGYANVILKASSGKTKVQAGASWFPIETDDVKMKDIMTFSYTNSNGTFNREIDQTLVAKGAKSTKTNEDGELVYDQGLFVKWNDLNFGSIYLTKGDNIINFNMNGEVGSGVNAGINACSLETIFIDEYVESIYGKDLKSESSVDKTQQYYVYRNDGDSKPEVKSDAGISYIGEVTNGAVINFVINSEVEQTVELRMRASSLSRKCQELGYWKPTETNDVKVADVFTLKVNDTDVTIPNTAKVLGAASKKYTSSSTDEQCDSQGRYYDDTIWIAWTSVSLGEVKLNAGYNVVTLTSTKDKLCNVYSLDIVFRG